VRLTLSALAVALSFPAGVAAAQDLPQGLVRLRDVDATIAQDMRYATTNNFTGRPLPGYDAGQCILARAAALALKRVQADLARENLSLKVYDCYRPTRAVAAMAHWAADSHASADTRRFYPALKKDRLFALGWIAAHSAHSRGVAVDLTVVTKGSPQPAFDPNAHYGSCAGAAAARAPDNSLDMGTGYDCFDPLAHPYNGRIRGKQRANRMKLRKPMIAAGFKGLETEWWHFTLRNEPYPETFFDFPMEAASLR